MRHLSILLLGALGISLAVAPSLKEKVNNDEEPSFFIASSPYDEPKYKTGITTSLGGPYSQKTHMYDRINMSNTWDTYRGANVKVGVIDTGCLTTHEDFSGTRISSHSYNVYSNTSTITDPHGHGTDTAACIAAAVNGVGGLGIAPDVELYIYQTSDNNGGFSNTKIKSALRRAIDDHVDIINMSIQGYTTGFNYSYVDDYDGEVKSDYVAASTLTVDTLKDLINEAHDAGITVVAAAGNYNTNNISYPAANNNVIGVGSTGLNDGTAKAGYSNYGSYVDVCAPGYVVVPSIKTNDSYQLWWGTSFSAPLVSGAIALYKGKYPSASPDQIEARLKATCDSLSYSGSGSGQINVANFLNNGPAETWISATGISLPNTFDIAIGVSNKLTPTFTPSNATRQTCYWSSSNNNVASVDAHGNITGVAEGVTTITATSIDGSFTDTCTVNVGEYIEVESVELSSHSVSIYEGKTHQLSWSFTPNNPSDDEVVFFSSDESVATVTDEGLITALKPGSTNITIMSTDGPTDVCAVTVNETPKETLVITRSSFSNSGGYNWYTWTQTTSDNQSISGKAELYTTTTTSMQFNKDKGNKVAALFNTTAIPGQITKISAKSSQTTYRAWNGFVSSTAYSSSGSTLTPGNNETKINNSAVTINGSQTDIGASNAGYSYFCVQETAENASYIDNFTITYIPKSISSISVKTSPTKTVYETGETFDPTGLVITATYDDSSTADISYASASSSFSFSPSLSTALTTSNNKVTITYSGKTVDQAITVKAPKVLQSISVSGQTTAFVEGDTFTFGGTVTAHYDDESSSDVTASSTFSGYNMNQIGNQTVTVTYSNKTTTYSINVGQGTLSSISVSGMTTSYMKNTGFSFDGTCTATFANGYQKVVTPTSLSIPDMSTPGDKTVTVSFTYNGNTRTTSYTINVKSDREVIETTTVTGYSVIGTITYPSNTQTISGSGISVSTGGYTKIESNAMRLGSGSNNGSITVTSTSANITKIVASAKIYGTDSNVVLSIDGTNNDVTSSYQDYSKEFATAKNSVTIQSIGKDKNRAYVQSITVFETKTTTIETDISNSEDCIGLELFISEYMHMDYVDNLGYCKDSTHHYYSTARDAFNLLNSHQRSLFTSNSAYESEWARLSTWASFNGESLDSNNLLGSQKTTDTLKTSSQQYAAIVLISIFMLSPLAIYWLVNRKKKKEK